MAFKLADIDDIPLGKAIIVKDPQGQEIGLFNIDGNIYALENVCPHMEGPLCEGDIEDGLITCPWHGWQFQIATGESENMPGENAKKIEIFIKDGSVYLNC